MSWLFGSDSAAERIRKFDEKEKKKFEKILAKDEAQRTSKCPRCGRHTFYTVGGVSNCKSPDCNYSIDRGLGS